MNCKQKINNNIRSENARNSLCYFKTDVLLMYEVNNEHGIIVEEKHSNDDDRLLSINTLDDDFKTSVIDA